LTGERVTVTMSTPEPTQIPHTLASRTPGIAFILKKASISALVALVLFSLMIGNPHRSRTFGAIDLLDTV